MEMHAIQSFQPTAPLIMERDDLPSNNGNKAAYVGLETIKEMGSLEEKAEKLRLEKKIKNTYKKGACCCDACAKASCVAGTAGVLASSTFCITSLATGSPACGIYATYSYLGVMSSFISGVSSQTCSYLCLSIENKSAWNEVQLEMELEQITDMDILRFTSMHYRKNEVEYLKSVDFHLYAIVCIKRERLWKGDISQNPSAQTVRKKIQLEEEEEALAKALSGEFKDFKRFELAKQK